MFLFCSTWKTQRQCLATSRLRYDAFLRLSPQILHLLTIVRVYKLYLLTFYVDLVSLDIIVEDIVITSYYFDSGITVTVA